MARRQAGLSGEDGARGRNCKPFPGGFGHHVCRHYDRHARCSLQPGQAPAGNPRHHGVRSAKPGPKLHLGMRESQGESRGGTPEGVRTGPVRAATQVAEVTRLRLTAFRVLPFRSFVARVEHGDTRERPAHRHDGKASRSHRRFHAPTGSTPRPKRPLQQTSGAKARRENDFPCSPCAAGVTPSAH